MAVKIRLARHGKKNYAFYNIVVADVRAPRDGRFIERIGFYNPNVNPAIIELNNDRALYWLNVGAQPTDTCRRILSYQGILLKKHLLEGVKKGAFTEEVAEQRWNAWKAEKDSKIQAKKDQISSNKSEAKKADKNAEALVNEERAKAIAKKKQEEAEALRAAEAEKAAQEAQVEEAPAEEVAATEETQAEATVATEETPAE